MLRQLMEKVDKIQVHMGNVVREIAIQKRIKRKY